MVPNQKAIWKVACFLSIFNFAAILHHAVFWRPTCMLNPFGPDYTPEVVIHWLSRDPALPWAILIAILIYHMGSKIELVKIGMYSFLPLTI